MNPRQRLVNSLRLNTFFPTRFEGFFITANQVCSRLTSIRETEEISPVGKLVRSFGVRRTVWTKRIAYTRGNRSARN